MAGIVGGSGVVSQSITTPVFPGIEILATMITEWKATAAQHRREARYLIVTGTYDECVRMLQDKIDAVELAGREAPCHTN
jgi:hypothetical protein